MKTIHFFSAILISLASLHVYAQELTYQRPPKEIEEIALAPLRPLISFSETNKWMLQLERSPFYSISELARPELRLAGVRIDPDYYYASRQRGFQSAEFVEVATGRQVQINGLPAGSSIAGSTWYPNADRILLFVKEGESGSGRKGIFLYTASVDEPQAKKLTDWQINATMGFQISWINETEFFTLAVPIFASELLSAGRIPTGPKVEVSDGKRSATRTYQDLLKTKEDADTFEHYFTSLIVRVSDTGSKAIDLLGVYADISLSPDRKYLMTEVYLAPYSFVVPLYNFPARTSIIDLEGNTIKTLAKNPVYIPAMGYDTTSPYPRSFTWRSDKPATVYWAEAQDEGNPRKNKVEFMDVVYQLSAPFTGEKEKLTQTQLRYRNITWGNDDLALITESSGATRRVKTYTFKPGNTMQPQLLFDYSRDDSYNDPGTPIMVKNQYGRRVLYTKNRNNELLMTSQGASPEGDMPYISSYQIAKKQNHILWRCQAPYYEQIVRMIDPDKLTFITSRQSTEEPANYFVRDLKKRKSTQITAFGDPYPSMKGVKKEIVRYKRADGVDLTATMYLPAGYDKDRDGRLPVLMWAYPIEYKSASDAAQVRGSKYTFTSINYGSPIFWVLRGYCVMDKVEMPIVGEKDTEPNDTYVEQLVMNAEAAIKAVSDLGVGDPERVGVGGHSYGAFMTANLMVNTKLFKAGIARSGAYNRTLTPFGFQAERRTYWEAPDVYNTMSPFMHADKLSGAILLIHGEADNNSGTFPIQSERFFQALKGHGATSRYVVLPLESHGYSAKESILHMLYEQDAWLEKHLK